MKRMRDDAYASASQFKRPLGSSRGESFGQSLMNGGGGAGSGGGGGGGGSSQKLTTNDALTYLKEVKEMFQDQREKYDMFLEVMKDFKAQRTDTAGVIARVKELFKGNNTLIYGFNTFLPKGYEITLDEDDVPPKKVEFEEAITFVNKIKKRFQHDEHVYKSFLDILNTYRKESTDINEVYSEVSSLFEDQPDLLEEFTRFLPESLAPHSALTARFGRSAERLNDQGSGAPPMCQMQIEKERRRERAIASQSDRDHSVDRSDFNDDKVAVRMQKEQRKRVEKESRDRRNRDLDDKEAEQDNLQHFPEKRKPSQGAEDFEAYSSPASHAEKDNLKCIYNQAFIFCEKVKERLCSQDDYQTFLKCLNIFSNGIIQRKDLQNLVSDLLGKFPDLMDEFNQFFERCQNIDGFQRLAGVMSKNSLGSEEHLSRSTKAEEKEREQKREIEAAKEKERYKEKYMGKSIQELDLSDCEHCTPSYRLLPQDYPIPSVSQRSQLGAEVLNDYWVSVTSGSEDYSFKHMRRNQYEESLFRCEDDRFELDMLLESVGSTAKRAEDLLNTITAENKQSFDGSRLEDFFTALNIRCIERLYGDHGLDALDILRKNPAAALPVILTRLKQKQDEWIKCREDFNKVWADVYAKNHYKSLDHRSFYFKQQDSKNLSAKSLVAEIKELKEKKQEEEDILLSISAGYKQPVIPHFEYEYSDSSIHEDLYKLVQFSCEEICSTEEQLSKVLKLWTSFLEPMLGVPTSFKGSGAIEDAAKTKHPDANYCVYSNGETNVASGADMVALISKQLKSAANRDEYASSGASKPGGIGLANRDFSEKENLKDIYTANRDEITCSAAKPEKKQENVNRADKRLGTTISMDVEERVATSNVSFPAATDGNRGKVGSARVTVSNGIQSRPNDAFTEDHLPADKIDTHHSTQGGVVAKPVVSANGMLSDASKHNRNNDESVGRPKVEKEEGELSPNGDFEDNFGVHGDLGAKSTPKTEGSVDGGENDDDADDEDSENAYEAGEDVSATESAGDECSQDENGGEENGEHDEVNGKAESEGEAEGLVNSRLTEDGGSLPLSEHVLLSVKPLAKHVAAVLLADRKTDSRVFYGNDDFYVLFRLHQILYERVLSAKTHCTGGEMKWKNSTDPYARFVSALYGLLDGSSENTKFEDECRDIIGNQSYLLFTLDKLIYKLVKQLQAVAADDMDNTLLQLYEYEKSWKPGKLIDPVYYENARVLLRNENIYRFESSSSPSSHLSFQLMHNIIEKPEAFAVSMDSTFASYLQNEFLSVSSVKKEPHDIVLQRNKRRYVGLDDLSANCEAMDGAKVSNGLECKMSCASYKISYVLDTEDFFHRRKKRLTNLSQDKSKFVRDRVERFHRFLTASR